MMSVLSGWIDDVPLAWRQEIARQTTHLFGDLAAAA
jgi:hypothetical protein